MQIEQKQLADLETVRVLAESTEISHYELAKLVERIGLDVVADSDDNGKSFIYLQGCWNPDGSEVCVGEIVGDSGAKIAFPE